MPAKPSASAEEIFRILDTLEGQGERITVVKVRKLAGGGGHARLSRLIDQWRAQRARTEAAADAAVEEGTVPADEEAGSGETASARSVAAAPPAESAAGPARGAGAEPAAPVPPQPAAAPDAQEAELARLRDQVAALTQEVEELWAFLRDDRKYRLQEMERVMRLVEMAHRRQAQAPQRGDGQTAGRAPLNAAERSLLV